MNNRDRLHKVLDLEGLRIQPMNPSVLEVKKRTSKKQGFIKCAVSDELADGIINSIVPELVCNPDDKGLVGFMIFVPRNEYLEMLEKEKKEGVKDGKDSSND